MFENRPSSALTNIKTVVETAAALVGGMWAYQKFFRGRTFTPRLELTISARAAQARALSNVFISVQFKKRGPLKG